MDLTVEDVLQEIGFTEEERKELPPNIIKEYIGGFLPTAEDLERPISETGLIELCKRVRCRVLMYRWNAVHDYVLRFRREGRLQNKTTKKAQKLLAKAVNKHKAHAVYTEEDMRPVHVREWGLRKKENLLRLELWEYDRQQKENLQHSNDNVQLEQAEQTEEMVAETQVEEIVELSDATETMGNNTETHSVLLQTAVKDSSASEQMLLSENLTTEAVDMLSESEMSAIAFRESQLSVPSMVRDYLNINTESMSMAAPDSECIFSELNTGGGQCTPAYQEFGAHIPLTSTQSQSQSPAKLRT